MQKRTLKELNLLDDFLFGSMVTYPGIGEQFVRKLLKIIFNREINSLKVVPQKIYYGSDTDKHGARLDVYIEEEADGITAEGANIFDLEPEQKSNAAFISALPKRVRFYHSKIDSKSLKSGKDYHHLKQVIVIMIMPFDPFGFDRMTYTIRSLCEEEPDMPYDDGARTLFLYTRGTKGNPPEALRQLLRYMEHTTQQNACSQTLQEIQQMVDAVKQDEEVSLEFMKIFEREEMLLNQGRDEGRKEEQGNTERERRRADEASAQAREANERADKAAMQAQAANERAALAEEEIRRLKKKIEELKIIQGK